MQSWLSGHVTGPMVLILLGALVSAAGALWASIQQGQSERELKNKNAEILALNQRIKESIIGGNSFCYFEVVGYDTVRNRVDLMLFHEGRYPLYDVGVTVQDVEKTFEVLWSQKQLPLHQHLSQTEALFAQAKRSISVGNLSVSQALGPFVIELGEADKRTFNIDIVARNGAVLQLLRFRRVSGHWRVASRVLRDQGVVKEQIDAAFPRESDGTIRW